MSYFMKLYYEKVFWEMYYKYNFNNIMNVPFIYKIILNSSCGKFFFNKKLFDIFFFDLYNICLQKPLIIKSKVSISEFKLKKNDNLSLKVTLRNTKMYNFFFKFLIFSVPLIKNFKGFSSNSFDSFGNYNFGISDYSIFLESQNSTVFNNSIGLNINIIFFNSNQKKSFDLLNYLNFPFLNV
ncbi:MAG: 50S ribosomal protein L5 [Candidatus Nasuia deltocephalinicola]